MTSRAPIDFGVDLSCVDDLDPAMAEVSGIEVLRQAIARRLMTPRGALWQDPNYGLDLRGYISKATDGAVLASLPGQVRLEILKDERIDSATVQVQRVTLFEIDMSVSCTCGLGPFSLALSVSEAAVRLTGGK